MDEDDYSQLNEEVKNANEPKQVKHLIKKYEELLKGENKKIMNIVGKWGKLLKFGLSASKKISFYLLQ